MRSHSKNQLGVTRKSTAQNNLSTVHQKTILITTNNFRATSDAYNMQSINQERDVGVVQTT